MSTLSLSRLLSLPPGLRASAVRRAITCQALQTPSSSPFRSFSTSRSDLSNTAHQQTTVNAAEVSHFNALASSWWDPHGSSKLLHLMNPLRHEFIRQCLESTHEPEASNRKKRYLDIGCGGGIFAESAARLWDTESVTAIDPSPEVIAVAKQHQRHDPLLLEPGRLSYQNTAIENLPAPSSLQEGYDIITLFEVIEHIQHPSPFLTQCLAHLKPGGWLVGSTIARTTVSWFTTKLVAEDLLRIVPRGTHDWNQYIQPSELRQWARTQSELDVDWQVMGVVYVPGVGWREVSGSEKWGNYFFGVRKREDDMREAHSV